MTKYDYGEIEQLLKNIYEDGHFVKGQLCFFKHLNNEQKYVFYDYIKNGVDVTDQTVNELMLDLDENDIEEVKRHFEEV